MKRIQLFCSRRSLLSSGCYYVLMLPLGHIFYWIYYYSAIKIFSIINELIIKSNVRHKKYWDMIIVLHRLAKIMKDVDTQICRFRSLIVYYITHIPYIKLWDIQHRLHTYNPAVFFPHQHPNVYLVIHPLKFWFIHLLFRTFLHFRTARHYWETTLAKPLNQNWSMSIMTNHILNIPIFFIVNQQLGFLLTSILGALEHTLFSWPKSAIDIIATETAPFHYFLHRKLCPTHYVSLLPFLGILQHLFSAVDLSPTKRSQCYVFNLQIFIRSTSVCRIRNMCLVNAFQTYVLITYIIL